MELEVFFGMREGMMWTSSFVRDAFKGGMKTLERMAPTPEVRNVFGLLNAMILDMEADAFVDGEVMGFPIIGAPSGLEAIPPLPQFLQPIRRRLPRFVKTQAGQFINMRNVESLWPSGNSTSSRRRSSSTRRSWKPSRRCWMSMRFPWAGSRSGTPAEKGGE